MAMPKELLVATLVWMLSFVQPSAAGVCDGRSIVRMTGLEGTFTIPSTCMYTTLTPNLYKNNKMVKWQITLITANDNDHDGNDGWTLGLGFHSLHLEDSFFSRCYYDYVNIEDEGTGEEWQFCGLMTNIPDIRASGRTLNVVFKSDYSINRPGFTAFYYAVRLLPETSAPTPTTTTPTTTTPTTTSPTTTTPTTTSPTTTSPTTTTPTTTSPTTTTPTTTSPTTMSPTTTSPTTTSPTTTTPTTTTPTTTTPTTTTPTTTTSTTTTPTTTTTTMTPTTTTTVTTTTTPTTTTAAAPSTSLSECTARQWSDHVIGTSGTISISSDQYQNQQNCTWTITVPVGKVVYFWLTFIGIESHSSCNYDSVSIYDGPTTVSPLNAKYCGTTLPPGVTSIGTSLTVAFYTDRSVTATGFTAEYEAVDPDDVVLGNCQGEVWLSVTSDASMMIVSSPNSLYPNNAYCTWKITAPPDYTIEVVFEYIEIEYHSSCNYDVLEVYDGDSGLGPAMERICGTLSNKKLESSGNAMFIMFTSDHSVVARGVKATCNGIPLAALTTTTTTTSTTLTTSATTTTSPTTPTITPRPLTECGLQQGFRIVGGEEAVPHAWPWTVSIQYSASNFHFCGGTIISKRWIVTAAHCTISTSAQNIIVRVGAHDLTDSSVGQSRQVYRIHNHPSYNSQNLQNDISLLQLSSDLVFSSNVYPACLATSDDIPGYACNATGWGYLQQGGPNTSPTLYVVPLPIVSNAVCLPYYSNYLTPKMLCAGAISSGTDTCQGDSGGPLVCKRPSSDVYELHGITSFGVGCGVYYGVYTRVTAYVSWIDSTILSA